MSAPDPVDEVLSGTNARIATGIALLFLGVLTCMCCGGISTFGDCGGPPEMVQECVRVKTNHLHWSMGIGFGISVCGLLLLILKGKR